MKPIIKTFDIRWSCILDLSLKLISLLVIWSYNCNNVAKKKVTHLGSSIVQVFRSTLNVIPQWISKPRIRRPYKHRKASSGAGKFAESLCTCKRLTLRCTKLQNMKTQSTSLFQASQTTIQAQFYQHSM